MRYLSVCSGIEAASVAWGPLGWTAVAVAEIEPFPRAVLAHHYPTVPNWGDLTRFQEWPDAAVDVLVGGTPCQSFSVAGLRRGLDDPRGSLLLAYLALARRARLRWLVWENVPGVLSVDGGRAFGSLLGGLAELGYGFAYRVLDAQYFGLAQRRKRVFVVGHLGDWRRAAAVLLERDSLSGHPAPRRPTGQVAPPVLGGGAGTRRTGNYTEEQFLVAPTLPSRTTGGGELGTDFDCDGGLIPTVANPLTHRMHKGINTTCDEGQTMIAHRSSNLAEGAPTVDAGRAHPDVVPPLVARSSRGGSQTLSPGYQTDGHITLARAGAMSVRRLTPRECERLQGFPDDYTLIPYRGKPASDGPRYKALGNSMAVPVMRWIGQRIAVVEGVC